MNDDVQAHVLQLLKSSQKREQKIRLLQYELVHYAHIVDDEKVGDLTSGAGKDESYSLGHFSDKTRCIALNCQKLTDKAHTEAAKEIAAELVELEDEQNRLCYYVSLLDNREATVIRRVYFDGCSWDQAAKELGVVRRTAHKIKERALTNLARMYEYMDGIRGNGAPTAL